MDGILHPIQYHNYILIFYSPEEKVNGSGECKADDDEAVPKADEPKEVSKADEVKEVPKANDEKEVPKLNDEKEVPVKDDKEVPSKTDEKVVPNGDDHNVNGENHFAKSEEEESNDTGSRFVIP